MKLTEEPMNNINNIAILAGWEELPTVRLAFQGFDKEKFAELIVEKCANINFRDKLGISNDLNYEIHCLIKDTLKDTQ
jgi:hypothetical protein